MTQVAELPELRGDLPNLAGAEDAVRAATANHPPVRDGSIDFANIKSCAAIALHMHQPMVPAGGGDLRTAKIINNLQHMMEHQGIGDNHNAPVFKWCYQRMGEFVPQLKGEGKQPRGMLEYSGNLLWGLRQMGAHDVLDHLKKITCDAQYYPAIEWLGCPWGHAVAPSTPMQDFRRHVVAWQHHFAGLFGLEALSRVRGFSPSEMALPNHPDVAYEYIKILREAGYEWLLVQEHTVEEPGEGCHPRARHLPHRMVCRNSRGEEIDIIAVIKTQGSDTKLVAQMQPWYEAASLDRWELAGKSVPPIVTQIADGENGGVMMNEFPPKYQEVVRQASGTNTPLVNVSEYLEYLEEIGITSADLPTVQPVWQKAIWSRVEPGCGPEALAQAIEEAKQSDHRFHMDGGSWTDDISWVKGYENVLGPMEQVSIRFHEVIDQGGVSTEGDAYLNALYHLMCSQTSCYRYWGQGQWTDYGREICRRAEAILNNDF